MARYTRSVSALLSVLLTSLALGVAACGGDDEEPAPAEESTPIEETTSVAEETIAAPSRVDLATPPGDELVFEPDRATAAAGPVTVVWVNESEVLHSLCLEDPQGKGVAPPGESVCSDPTKTTGSPGSGTITATYPNLKPGQYTFYCDVDGHRAQGMEGTLTIE
jgi:plastocyanin